MSAPRQLRRAVVLLPLLLFIIGAPVRTDASTPATSVTAATALAVGPHLSAHPAPGFTLEGFDPALPLLARIWIVTSPAGVTFGIAETTGLTASGGTPGWTDLDQLGFRGTASAVQNALASLTLSTGSTTGALVLGIEVQPDPDATTGLAIDPRTGHLYRFVPGDRTWQQARDGAQSEAFRIDGVDGHLVTITSAAENAFVRSNTPLDSTIWLGLSDDRNEGVWRWETGPEGAATGGDGQAGRRLSDTGFAAWASGQPDNSFFAGGLDGEDFAVMGDAATGTWFDRTRFSSVDGHVVEYSAWGGRSFPSRRSATLTTVVARPPRDVTASAGDGSATVSWQEPLFGTVTGYAVTTALAAGGAGGADPLPGCTTDGARSCTVSGLTNGVAVTFTVAATFTDEGGSVSAASPAITPTAAPPPPPAPAPAPAEEEESAEDAAAPAEVTPAAAAAVPTPEPTPEPQDEPTAEEPPGAEEAPATSDAGDPSEPPAGPSEDGTADVTAPIDTDQERRPPFPTFSALEEPEALVATVTSGLALLGVAGSAAAAAGAAAGAAGRGGGAGGGRGSGGGEQEVEREGVTGVDVFALGAVAAGQARGDRSRWWRWPGTDRVDRAGRTLMRRTAVPLPLVARAVEDGAALRAMFGSLALLLPLGGLVLGAVSALDTGGIAMPPSTALMAAIVLLGLLDASTGLVAFVTFFLGVAVGGGIVDGDSVRTLLGIGVASFGPGLIAALFRPIRRPPARTADERWERFTDVAVVSVVGAMSVQLMVGSLSGIAGYALPVSDLAGPLALAALPILALRVGLEELAARHFPARLSAVVADDLPERPVWRDLLMLAGKAATFIFVGLALIGPVWQLPAAALLFVLAPLLGLAGERLPNSPLLWRLLPQGIPGFVLLLLIGGWSAGVVEAWLGSSPDYARMSFVALAAPYTLIAVLGLLGREGAEGEERWVSAPERRLLHRIGGVVMLALLVRLHLG